MVTLHLQYYENTANVGRAWVTSGPWFWQFGLLVTSLVASVRLLDVG